MEENATNNNNNNSNNNNNNNNNNVNSGDTDAFRNSLASIESTDTIRRHQQPQPPQPQEQSQEPLQQPQQPSAPSSRQRPITSYQSTNPAPNSLRSQRPRTQFTQTPQGSPLTSPRLQRHRGNSGPWPRQRSTLSRTNTSASSVHDEDDDYSDEDFYGENESNGDYDNDRIGPDGQIDYFGDADPYADDGMRRRRHVSSPRRSRGVNSGGNRTPRASRASTLEPGAGDEFIEQENMFPGDDDDDEGPITLKDRQEAMNQIHPFGMPLWKPALYKKSRSAVRNANAAVHSTPHEGPELYLYPGNIAWTLLFGWWMAAVMFVISIILFLTPNNGRAYSRVMRGLAGYLFWPFGRYVERREPWDSETGDGMSTAETAPLLNRAGVGSRRSYYGEEAESIEWGRKKKKGLWENIRELGLGGLVFYLFYYTLIGPFHYFVSALSWFFVISIPMAKLTYVLASHLRRHPLSLYFQRGSSLSTRFSPNERSVILLCTYKALGFQYYKYTYDGINIMFINLMPFVLFVIVDEFLFEHWWGKFWLTEPLTIFVFALFSVIPLSYFIGMAVSSISAQSSMGIGAVINATFGSIIEIILYGIMLNQNKSVLVEGSIIGSILAGVLLMPGFSMISGGFKRKEQKFNAKSAGVTSTMLIMALIGVLTPTLFYSIYGSYEIKCTECPSSSHDPSNNPLSPSWDCQRCYYDQSHPIRDPFYINNVKPLILICVALLPTGYLIGLWFSLHTHVKQVWESGTGNRRQSLEHPLNSGHSLENHHRDSSLYRRFREIPHHVLSQLITIFGSTQPQPPSATTPHATFRGDPRPPASAPAAHGRQYSNPSIIRNSISSLTPANDALLASAVDNNYIVPPPKLHEDEYEDEGEAAGHDSPNWTKVKSVVVLLLCTVLYAIIAEILVDTVDEVLENSNIDEKFLGLTLFALVPNITEFMNAISFALHGNIVLSLEIGSAYALQVCLIQIPAMVGMSVFYNWGAAHEVASRTFTLIFPRWDILAVLFSVFLLTYTYQEGKSNYFKGSILCLSYLILIGGFFYTPPVGHNGQTGLVANSAGEMMMKVAAQRGIL